MVIANKRLISKNLRIDDFTVLVAYLVDCGRAQYMPTPSEDTGFSGRMSILTRFVLFSHIPYTPNSTDVTGIQFFTQIMNMHLQRIAVDILIPPVDALH